MSSEPLPTVDLPPRRSTSSMSMRSHSRSSRELSASALEREKNAKDAAERKMTLLAQIQALQAQAKAEEEKELREREQAEADRQAARLEHFRETSSEKQAKFRSELADEVLTRVALTVHVEEIRSYVQSIAQQEPGSEVTSLFKEMLWTAIAGDDPAFLPALATKILERSTHQIDDHDLELVGQSNACLNPDKPAQGVVEVITSRTAQVTDPQTEVTANSVEPDIESANKVQEEVVESDFEQEEVDRVKRESTTHEQPHLGQTKRTMIDDLEVPDDTQPVHCASNTKHEGEGFEAMVQETANDLLTNEPGAKKKKRSDPPKTPNPNRKRPVEDDDETESVATTSSKKQKTSSQDKSPYGKLSHHFEELAARRNLAEDDFLCSSCNKTAVNPRVTAKCQHIYCMKCLTVLRDGARGKDVAKVKCGHVDCSSVTGSASKITPEEIAKLRETFKEKLDDATSDSDDQDDEKEVMKSKRRPESYETDESGEEDE